MYENHWAILDGAAFQDKKKAHEIIGRELSFPSYYGGNLDALYDCLTEMGQTEIDLFSCAQILRYSESYGTFEEGMRDLAAPLFNGEMAFFMDLALRNEMQAALADAVVYCVRGAGRAAARGLSFCYCPNFTRAELETYARNCFCPHYLALLDAISENWNAPDWIYEAADGPSRLETPDDYHVVYFLDIDENGVPGIRVTEDNSLNISCGK